jgi:hypothetical protein
MDRILFVGLVKIELPDHTILLCDGGFLIVDGEEYSSSDPYFGTIEKLESLEEGVGDEVPAGRLTFLPKSTAAAADLSAPGMQGSRVRFYIAEVDEATGTVIGTPDLRADMQTDQTILRTGRGIRKLEMMFVSRLERLFSINEGNSLSPRFHKTVWPGELGEDNATGVGVAVAWGVEGAPRGSTYSGGGVPGWGGTDLQDFMNAY